MSKKSVFNDIFGPGGTMDQFFGKGGTFDQIFGQAPVATPYKAPEAPEAPEAQEDCTADEPEAPKKTKRAKKPKKPKIRVYRHGRNTELEIDLPGRVISDITIAVTGDRVLVINAARTSTRKIRKACRLMFALEIHSDAKTVTTTLINGVLLVRIGAYS